MHVHSFLSISIVPPSNHGPLFVVDAFNVFATQVVYPANAKLPNLAKNKKKWLLTGDVAHVQLAKGARSSILDDLFFIQAGGLHALELLKLFLTFVLSPLCPKASSK